MQSRKVTENTQHLWLHEYIEEILRHCCAQEKIHAYEIILVAKAVLKEEETKISHREALIADNASARECNFI